MKIQASEAWQVLAGAYTDRLATARAAAAAGCPVIGVVGNTVPVELVFAAGALAVQVTGSGGPTPATDAWLETFFDSDVRAICEQALRGELAFLQALVIPRSTEPYHKLYLSLRELARLGRAPQLPPVLLYDLPHTEGPGLFDYGLARTRELAEMLAQLTGRALTDERLHVAIRSVNGVRRARQDLQRARQADDGNWSGEQAQMLNGAARFMQPQRYAELLPEAMRLHGVGATGRGPRLLLKGVPLDHVGLHRAVDQAGAVIVAEDDAWGTRGAWPLVEETGDPLAALVRHYQAHEPCPRVHPRARREAWFRRALNEIAFEGVLFYLPPPDDVHGWDLPTHRATLLQRGIPHLVLRDAQPDPEQLHGFVRTLGARR